MIAVVSIPAFFYVSIEKRSYKESQIQNLEHYAYGIEKTIYDFSRTKEHVFNFPRSLFYDASLYDKNENIIFSTSENLYKLDYFNTDIKNMIYRKITLNPNRLQAKYLVVFHTLSYKEIYTKALISALFLGAVIFIMTLFFIKISLRPLERVNRYLTTFFNDAMHELKTPLGVMQLNLEMLRDKEDNKLFRRLFNSMQSMILIYDDIEYHIKHTHVDYRVEKIDASHFLNERILVFDDLAKAKQIKLHKNIADEVELLINRIELQRIIDNTLSNAIKYSKKETEIFVTLKKEAKKIVLSIQDQGRGIKDIKKIFHRYSREDTIQGGFGIGLSIVKHICDKNNITIDVDTKLDKGSIFTYTFIVT